MDEWIARTFASTRPHVHTSTRPHDHTTTRRRPRHVTSRHVTSRHVTSRHVTSRHVVLSRRRPNESNPSSASNPSIHPSIHPRRPTACISHGSRLPARTHPCLPSVSHDRSCVPVWAHTERDGDPATPPRPFHRRAPRGGCLCRKHTPYRVNTKKTTKGEGPCGRRSIDPFFSPFKRSIHGRRGTLCTTRARRAMRLVRAAVSHVGGWVMVDA